MVSDSTIALPAGDIAGHGPDLVLDRLSDSTVTPHGGRHVLRPGAARWLVALRLADRSSKSNMTADALPASPAGRVPAKLGRPNPSPFGAFG